MAWVQTREFKVCEHGGRNTEICEQFTKEIEEKGNCKVSVRTDIPSFLYVHEVTRVFHDIKSALNSAGNINSYAAVVVFRKSTRYENTDSSDLYSRPRPLGIPNELPIIACYWFEKNCKQQLCDCEENKKSVEKLVHLIKELQTKNMAFGYCCFLFSCLFILGVLYSAQHAFISAQVGEQSSDLYHGLDPSPGPSPGPRPEPLLPNPWRGVEFSDDAYKKLQEEIKKHQPQPKASTTNILISGNVGSGKSSFINSVLSELRREEFNDRVQSFQTTRQGAETSVTQHLRCHTFNDKIKIFDTAGFELEKTVNATIILKKIIDGEVAEGTKFDGILETKSSMERDKIHCVVLVISIHTDETVDPALIRCYEEIIRMLRETGVPCQLLVTFVDRLVEKTEDLKNLYRRKDIKQKIENLAKEMRISMSNVIVISNYFEEMKINQIKGTLLLEAFAQMLMAAKPFQERIPEPRPEPRPEPLLPNPWREVEFSDDAYKKLQEEIKNHQPHPKASTTNILISGSVGSGKSSFINSVLSELRREEFNGRVQNIQAVRPGAETSVTQHLKCHTFNDKMKIFDTAGFELGKTVNASIILKKIIDGEVAEDTKFDGILETKSSMERDKIHCVVLVISIHTDETVDPALIWFYEELIGTLTETGVPYQLLVTFVDRLVEKTVDLKNLYRRRDIKQKIENVAKKMRISMSNVLVVSNYFEEMKINQIKGTLLLEAFAQMLMAAKPFQERIPEPRPEPRPEPLLPNPWREVEFSDDAYKKLQEDIKNHQPHPKASTTNILITGNVGFGKSSFLNSVLSELRREEFNDRVENIQAVRPGAQTSVTQRLKCHKFNDKMKIFDTAGFELEKTVTTMIMLKKIIDGEVAEGTKFDDILKTNIKIEGDKIHCVVLVISIHNAENLDPALIQFYKEFIGMLTETGVPYQLLVTFIDKLVEKTEDLKDLYRKRDIKQKIENVAKKMRISMSNVLVVSNYLKEEKINQIKGTLLLEAFAQMLMAAKPFQERM
ncbi:uncharacterized protein LOC117965625 isoform X2 [Acipenser ruthenus]|uniref:uncharacterized protein LOC117965625 isoform X2 n=1 Tax=Acipenser ruthenus TaxID=7906 RepID=UPI0027418722|nr:uncharacterized protein LOC117965625 isoform X2 [Acipenser ruthenus]